MDLITTLPFDLREYLLIQSDITTVLQACRVNKLLSQLCRQDSFWIKKYRLDYNEEITKDVTANALKLTHQQTYIRRFTYQGGVTYGSQAFLNLSILLPRAIMTENVDLIEYYMTCLKSICLHYADLPEKTRTKLDLIDWYEAAKAALKTNQPDLAGDIVELADQYIRKDTSSRKDITIKEKARTLLRAYLGLKGGFSDEEGHLRRSLYLGFKKGFDNEPFYLGALLGGHYDRAEERFRLGSDSGGYELAKVALELGEDDWLYQMQDKYPDRITDVNLIEAAIATGNDVSDESVSRMEDASFIISMMSNSKNYIPHLYQHILSFWNPSISGMPCRDEIIQIYQRYGFTDEEIEDEVGNLGTCDPKTFDRFYHPVMPTSEELAEGIRPASIIWTMTTAVEEDNIDLLWHLGNLIGQEILRFRQPDEDFSSLLYYLQLKGYKDIWLYVRSLTQVKDPNVEEESVEMYLFRRSISKLDQSRLYPSSLIIYTRSN